MKPEEMNQEKLINWIQDYLKRSKENIRVAHEEFYDAVNERDDTKADLILRDMIIKQAVHANLLEELMQYEEYNEMIAKLAEAAEKAPKA